MWRVGRNQVNVLVTILASVWNAFSGPNVVNPWLMQCYNIVHCHMPIFVFAMHDRPLFSASFRLSRS